MAETVDDRLETLDLELPEVQQPFTLQKAVPNWTAVEIVAVVKVRI